MNTQSLQQSIHRFAGLVNLFESDNIAIIHAINQYCHDIRAEDPAAYGLTKSNCGFVLSAIECAMRDLSILLETLGRTANHFPTNDYLAS